MTTSILAGLFFLTTVLISICSCRNNSKRKSSSADVEPIVYVNKIRAPNPPTVPPPLPGDQEDNEHLNEYMEFKEDEEDKDQDDVIYDNFDDLDH